MMSDHIDELVERFREDISFRGVEAAFATVAEIATIARDCERMKEQVRFHAEAYREAKAEADKWRKVAEEVAKMAADLSEEFVGAGVGPGEFIDEALRRILIKQEEIK